MKFLGGFCGLCWEVLGTCVGGKKTCRRPTSNSEDRSTFITHQVSFAGVVVLVKANYDALQPDVLFDLDDSQVRSNMICKVIHIHTNMYDLCLYAMYGIRFLESTAVAYERRRQRETLRHFSRKIQVGPVFTVVFAGARLNGAAAVDFLVSHIKQHKTSQTHQTSQKHEFVQVWLVCSWLSDHAG